MSEEKHTFIPQALAMAMTLAIVGAWGVVVFAGGTLSVYAWVVLIQLTLPLFGIFGLVVAAAYAYLKRDEWAWVATAVWLGLVASWPALWTVGIGQIAYPIDIGDAEPAYDIRIPTDEEMLVIWGGNEFTTNYHAGTTDQRWGYDLTIEPALHRKSSLEDYGCWGEPVLAPASGKVVATRGEDPDNRPGKLPEDFEHPWGNHVAIALEGQTHLVVGHLQQGSVAVEVGQEVDEGDVIGKCGNSGLTSEPHIHVHHQRQNPAEWPVGLTEGLPLYFRDHDGNRMPSGGVEVGEGDVLKSTGEKIKPIEK